MASRSDPLHFVEVFVWQPTGDKWTLQWFLYEVFQGELSMAATEPALATATGREPPATSSFDPRALIELRVNDSGHAEITMLRTAQPRTAVIDNGAFGTREITFSTAGSAITSPPRRARAATLRARRRTHESIGISSATPGVSHR